jgi:hypothetical protein
LDVSLCALNVPGGFRTVYGFAAGAFIL